MKAILDFDAKLVSYAAAIRECDEAAKAYRENPSRKTDMAWEAAQKRFDDIRSVMLTAVTRLAVAVA